MRGVWVSLLVGVACISSTATEPKRLRKAEAASVASLPAVTLTSTQSTLVSWA
jgi:hypothetical protein